MNFQISRSDFSRRIRLLSYRCWMPALSTVSSPCKKGACEACCVPDRHWENGFWYCYGSWCTSSDTMDTTSLIWSEWNNNQEMFWKVWRCQIWRRRWYFRWFRVWCPRQRTMWPNYIWRVCVIWQRYRRLLSPYQPTFDTSEENWWEVLWSECINSVVKKEIGPENDDEIENVTKDIVNFPPNPLECLDLLEKLIKVSISNKEILLLNSTIKWFGMAITDRKTQKTIQGYFSQIAMKAWSC